jgi:uncharacterized membrane protein YfcA
LPITEILLLVIAGLVGGFLAGMLGVGGGIVFVPVIQLILTYHKISEGNVSYTLANSLVIVFAVGISGTIKQLKLKNTHLPSALVTGISASISSMALTYFIFMYNLSDPKLFNYIFAFILVLTAIRMLFSSKLEATDLVIPDMGKFIPAGLFAGVVTALSGLGGGVVMVPYFNKVLKLPIRFATGLSLSVIPMIALPLIIFYASLKPVAFIDYKFQTGYLVWPLLLPVIASAILASGYGVKFAQKLSAKTLTTVFITFVILTLVKILIF